VCPTPCNLRMSGQFTERTTMSRLPETDYDRFYLAAEDFAVAADEEPRDYIGDDGRNRWVGSRIGDVIEGLGAADTLYGMAGDDTIRGGDGNDLIYGGGGADILRGEDGRDRIFGGSGVDFIYGGKGNDVLTGGSDRDYFDYRVIPGTGIEDHKFGKDIITDFEAGVDRIRLGSGDPKLERPYFFDNFADVIAHSYEDQAGNVIVRYNSNNFIRLIGVGKDELSAEDFLFGAS
jgi:Ca2+-binding RTX toxin-like protein